jgi:aspartate/tyrosine/aromatic aminotransferase
MGKTAGFAVKSYKYYNAAEKSIDFDGLVHDLDVGLTFLNFEAKI